MRRSLNNRHLYRHLYRLTALFSVGVGIAGCSFDAEPVPTAPSNTSPQPVETSAVNAPGVKPVPGYWTPQPVRIVLFPGTRWREHADGPVIATAVELRDAMGDPTKAAGTLRIQWIKPALARQTDTVLNTWTIELQTLKDQQTHWSPILRSYALDLTVNNPAERQNKTLLVATYLPPDPTATPIRAEIEIKSR